VTGNVAKIDSVAKTISLVVLREYRLLPPKPAESSVIVKPATRFWRVSLGEADGWRVKVEADASRVTMRPEKAVDMKFDDVAVGDRILVLGTRAGEKISADTIVDEGPSFPAVHDASDDSCAFGVYGNCHVGKGTFFVAGLSVNFKETGKAEHNITIACRNFVAERNTIGNQVCLHYGQQPAYGYSAYYCVKSTDTKAIQAIDDAVRAVQQPCAIALNREAEAAANERKVAAEEAERRALEGERERQAAAAKRATEFHDGMVLALRAAEEPDPFASIRGDFDLSGSDSRQWKTSMQLPDAEKCALLKTAASTPTAASAWTFGCLFRASSDGYERMVKSVQSILKLPYLPDEKAVNINQVFFADASKPASRLFVAKINAATVGISVVAVRVAGVAPNAVSPDAFAKVPTMLPTEPTVPEGVAKVPSGQIQPAATAAECEAYQKGVRERASGEEAVRRLGTELSGLQMSYQNAMQQALESDQRASVSCSAGGGGLVGGINAMGCSAARLTSQQKRAEAQSLQLQINQKQSQITSAQTSLITSAPSALPPGCRTDGTMIIATPGSSSTGSAASVEPTVHDVVEKIRAGDHAAMPPAQSVTVNALAVSGQTTMTVKNSTAYELSVFFDGPVSTKLTIMPGASQDVDLAPGTFHVAGRVTAADVIPFYGEETYSSSARYSVTFYIVP